MSATADPWTVVKVGGSLYHLPDLRERLCAWLAQRGAKVLLVPGGGITADVIRILDGTHRLGQEAAHWLAIRSLSLNACFLHELLPAAQVTAEIPESAMTECPWHILDAYPFFRADEQRSDHLPHHWNITSDSLAVRVAVRAHAQELILLKSIDWPGSDWSEAVRSNIVDGYFVDALRQAPATLAVRIINGRS